MAIVVRIDVELAKRKMSVGEFAEQGRADARERRGTEEWPREGGALQHARRDVPHARLPARRPARVGRGRRVSAVDVLVVGAGLAGLETATQLARRGHEVLLVERRTGLGEAIRTTGIFVRKTLDDFDLPPESLGPAIRRVMLYPPGMRRPIELRSDRDEFRVGDMGPLYNAYARDAADAGVRIMLGTRYLGYRYIGYDEGEALLDGPEAAAREAAVPRGCRRSSAPRSPATPASTAIASCWSGPKRCSSSRAADRSRIPWPCSIPISRPATLAWAAPTTARAHVGVVGGPQSGSAMACGERRAVHRDRARSRAACAWTRRSDARADPGRRVAEEHQLAIAACWSVDAAGAVLTLTAGGPRPAFAPGGQAAEVLDEAARRTPCSRCALRRCRAAGAIPRRITHFAADASARPARPHSRRSGSSGCALLGKAAARAILFGDRSFPDAACRGCLRSTARLQLA